MKIVVTNDDGYGEPGLEALYQAVRQMGRIVTVAPRQPQSIAGHRVTIREPIRVDEVAPDRYAVHGSPADCTRLALKRFAPDADWVIAGINPGANLGTDVYQSGTVAAAREAAILGVRAAAVSQYIARNRTIDWGDTCHQAFKILAILMQKTLAPGQYWNINLPHPERLPPVPAYKICPVDRHPHDYTYEKVAETYLYQGIIHDRPYTDGSDVDVCFSGEIAVSLMEI